MRYLCLAVIAAASALGQSAVYVVGHRGFKAVAPENTIASFEAAADAGTDYIELDVRPSKDGLLILMHDGEADRTTNGKGPVSALTFGQIRALDAGKGQRVPTLKEALLWAKRRGVRIDIDHKAGPVEDIAAEIEETGMIRGVVIEGNRANLLKFSQLLPGVDTMPKVQSVEDVTIVCKLLRTTVIRLSVEQTEQRAYVDAVRACGARVSITILGRLDNERDMRRLIGLGAQLIETDHPDLVAKVRASLK